MPINGAKISAYTYCRNVIEMKYPVQECVDSLIPVCDEIVILDASDKDDGTGELLKNILASNPEKIKVYTAEIPWKDKNHGIYDGQTKAAARELCTGDILLQIDLDEILEDAFAEKLDNLLKETNNLEKIELLALPVVDYWGGREKVRMDVNPWKWRISRNLPHITHGIPSVLRQVKDGLLYAKPGTDGCNYIHAETGEPIQFVTFAPGAVDELRRRSFKDEAARVEYEKWFEKMTDVLPSVYHLSWWSIEKKILNYKQFWNGFWPSLYGEEKPQGKDWNPFFGFKLIEDHTEEEIKAYAKQLREETGGHVFHTQWIGQKTPHIFLNKPVPSYARKWCEENADQ